ncbi:hypothetical protein KFE25_003719 [Diacronema lutheri]|uniref:Thioredoxin domain-containing protein n=2 Tax=Diacronema lutheri TaxID=2081491 RepID=A0A8J6C4S4_DIALT|nr:hypothetical protein KFE25_003719 [Diacronema lutheri]
MAALGARSVGKRARAFVGAAVLLALAGVEVEAAKKGKVKRARGGAADAPDGTVETVRAADLRARAANATLALATFTVDAEYCGEECARFDALVARAARDVRIKDPSIWFARVVIDPTEPVPERLGALLGPQPGLPQLILFKAGEPLAWHADATRAAVRRADLDDDVDADSPALARAVGLPTSARAIEARMLAEASRPLVTPLRTAKQLERFLHLDAWAATHAADEPPRVVGFFPPSALGDGGGRPSARYDLFRAVAARLQSMLPFGECTDPSLQARMLGQPSSGATVQIVKASRTERKVPFAGPWTARALGRFIASHSGELVQDVGSEEVFHSALGLGLPALLLLMPDTYENELGPIMAALKQAASKHRSHLTFIYGFKETDPWPLIQRALGLAPRAGEADGVDGALIAFVGASASPAGHDFGREPWLPPPPTAAAGGGGGFALYEVHRQPPGAAAQLTAGLLESLAERFVHAAYARAGWALDGMDGEAEAEDDAPSEAAIAAGALAAADCDAAGNCAPAPARAEPGAAAASTGVAAGVAVGAAAGAAAGAAPAPTRAERDEVKALLQKKLRAVEAQLASARAASAACDARLHALVAAVQREAPGVSALQELGLA